MIAIDAVLSAAATLGCLACLVAIVRVNRTVVHWRERSADSSREQRLRRPC